MTKKLLGTLLVATAIATSGSSYAGYDLVNLKYTKMATVDTVQYQYAVHREVDGIDLASPPSEACTVSEDWLRTLEADVQLDVEALEELSCAE